MAMPSDPSDEPERPEDRQTLAYLADHLVVPDDISALDEDVRQWHHEQSRARRRARIAWVIPPRWRSFGITAPLLIATALLLGSFGAMLTLFTPSQRARPNPVAAPLAHPDVPAGRLGGLLPDIAVSSLDGSTVSTRTLKRPAVLVLAPKDCPGCAAAIGHLAATAEPYALAQYVVATSAADARQYVAANSRLLTGLVDPKSSLLGTFGQVPQAPTLVVVGSDGTVRAITPGVAATTALTSQLDKAFAAVDATAGAHT